ncbi:MAG: DUF6445 family protein [Aquincola sp.]|nr:DUF6445 family protein [Aquincola sp.]
MASPARRYRRFLLVSDDFYRDPMAVYRLARESRYEEPENATGHHSLSVHHERGARARLSRLLGVRITRWDTDPDDYNGVFYQGFAAGARHEVPGVHFDHPPDDITAVVYLTPGLPPDCGTSLWMHRATGLADAPIAADARRLGCPLAELRERLERDAYRRERWVEIDRAGYRFNRLVAYPSGVLHSATRHWGDSPANGRLYQTFRVGVDWASGRW